VVETIAYDEHYGRIIKHWKREDVETLNPYGYTGREIETNELYYYRARYYDAGIQRFLSRDPIGFSSGDFNFYRYVGNNVVNRRDPFGLEEISYTTGNNTITFENQAKEKNMIYLLDYEKDWKYTYERTVQATKIFRDQHPNSFSIYAHGSPTSISALDTDGIDRPIAYNLEELLSEAGYKKGQDIILFSCNTGRNPLELHPTWDYTPPIAQDISNKLNATVYAPTGYLAISDANDNAYFIKYEPSEFIPHLSVLLPWSDESKLKRFTSENK